MTERRHTRTIELDDVPVANWCELGQHSFVNTSKHKVKCDDACVCFYMKRVCRHCGVPDPDDHTDRDDVFARCQDTMNLIGGEGGQTTEAPLPSEEQEVLYVLSDTNGGLVFSYHVIDDPRYIPVTWSSDAHLLRETVSALAEHGRQDFNRLWVSGMRHTTSMNAKTTMLSRFRERLRTMMDEGAD